MRLRSSVFPSLFLREIIPVWKLLQKTWRFPQRCSHFAKHGGNIKNIGMANYAVVIGINDYTSIEKRGLKPVRGAAYRH